MELSKRHETVMDPSAEHLGRIYAQALMATAQKAGVAEAVVAELQSVVGDVVSQHPSLESALASPRVDASEKVRVIDRLFADKVNSVLLRFLKVVASRGRLAQLGYIANAAADLLDETLGRVVAEVSSAVPLTDELRQSVTSRLSAALDKQIVIKEKVDPAIIGGLVIRVGDSVFDTSVAGRLDQMAKRTRQSFAHQLISKADRFLSTSG